MFESIEETKQPPISPLLNPNKKKVTVFKKQYSNIKVLPRSNSKTIKIQAKRKATMMNKRTDSKCENKPPNIGVFRESISSSTSSEYN